MLRLLIIFCLVFVGTMQGVAIGKVDLITNHTVSAELDRFASHDDVKEECCDNQRAIDKIPTLCKLDCKAMIPAVSLSGSAGANSYDWNLSDPIRSISHLVDLGPPKA